MFSFTVLFSALVLLRPSSGVFLSACSSPYCFVRSCNICFLFITCACTFVYRFFPVLVSHLVSAFNLVRVPISSFALFTLRFCVPYVGDVFFAYPDQLNLCWFSLSHSDRMLCISLACRFRTGTESTAVAGHRKNVTS